MKYNYSVGHRKAARVCALGYPIQGNERVEVTSHHLRLRKRSERAAG